MSLIIILGFKTAPDKAPEVECLYVGFDADKGHALSEEAADAGDFSKITRIVNPAGAQLLRVEPHSKVRVAQINAEQDRVNKALAQKAAETKAAQENAEKQKAAAAEQAKSNQAAADAATKVKQAENQTKADEFVAGKRFLKQPAKTPAPAATQSNPS